MVITQSKVERNGNNSTYNKKHYTPLVNCFVRCITNDFIVHHIISYDISDFLCKIIKLLN